MRCAMASRTALLLLLLALRRSCCEGRRPGAPRAPAKVSPRSPSTPSCFHEALGRPGRCELLTSCPPAIRERESGGRPQLCGFPPAGPRKVEAFLPLVCCPRLGPGPPPLPSPSESPSSKPVHSDSACCSAPKDAHGEPAAEVCDRLLARKEDAPRGEGETVAERMCRAYERQACGLSMPTITATAPSDGEPAGRMEFPHMALLGYGSDPTALTWACGGSLIAPDWVLTAAHCIASGSDRVSYVLLGALFRSEAGTVSATDASSASDRQLLAVAEAVAHPEYVVTGRYHDVALLRLARPAQTSRHGVRPACLHTDADGDPEGLDAVATGWGATGFGEDVSEQLIKVNLTIRSQADCRRNFNQRTDSKLRSGLLDGQLCAGGGGSERDTCQGDSGGPLQVPVLDSESPAKPSCLYRLVGVVSFGPACGIGRPGVYSRVSHYVPWVEAVVWGGAGRRRGEAAVEAAVEAPSGSCSLLQRGNHTLRLPITGNGTLARRMCRSYMLDWCPSSGPLAMQPGLTPRDACHFHSDVGTSADPVDYPHMALLVYGDDYNNEEVGCSASLISTKYLLTAARCATLGCLPMKRALLGVMLGRGSLRSHYRSRSRQEVAVSSVIVHPDYARDRHYNDVALVKLAKAVTVTALVRPACLHTHRHGLEAGLLATATGWEATGRWEAVDGELRRSVLPVRDSDACLKDLQGEGLAGGLRDTQLCAGGLCPNTTYPGEPGGPLQVVHRVLEAKDGLRLRLHRVLGVSSLNPPCGRCLPDVFTRIAAFVPWIEGIVWGQVP